MKFLIVLSLLAFAANAVRYDGYKTYSIVPRDATVLSFMENLEKEYRDVFDFWKEPSSVGRSVDIMVAPERQPALEKLLRDNNVDYSIGLEDIQVAIDNAPSTAALNKFDLNKYNSYSACIYAGKIHLRTTHDTKMPYDYMTKISRWIDDFSAANPNLVTKFCVGETFEGRSICGVKIGANQGGSKKAVYYEGGIHAREWISPATVLNIANYLVQDYGKDPLVTNMLDTFDYYIVPLLNCDGYEYTRATNGDRLWRKNRNTNGGKLCKGVDLNRNWPRDWDLRNGASDSACSDTYRGQFAASEPEISAITQFLENQNREWVSFIDFHAYSQLVLSPWSCSKLAALPQDKDDQQYVGECAASALELIYGTHYTVGPSARTLYAASGCSEDWAYVDLQAKYSYVVELRPENSNPGFILPESEIVPSSIETYELVKDFGLSLLNEFGI